MPRTLSERTLLFLVGAVSCSGTARSVECVRPCARLHDGDAARPRPDFAAGLGIPTSRLGLVGGSYTAAAAASGLAGALSLDRFDRRRALPVARLGLVVGTAASGLATGLGTLLAAPVVAGAFGGPATSLAISIVADAVPPERRGRAMGAVMGAFSIASIAGVPGRLELARFGGWRLPFFAVAGVGLVVASTAAILLPPMRGHLEATGGRPAHGIAQFGSAAAEIGAILRRPVVVLALASTATSMMAGFAIIPNLSAYLQRNLGYPRGRLGLLYLVGGAVSFGILRVARALVDRVGAPSVALAGTASFLVITTVLFVRPAPGIPVLAIFVALMATSSCRAVPLGTLSTRVPDLAERARFTSMQSAVQHLASAAGAFLSVTMLDELADGRLLGMERVGLFSIALAMPLPLLLRLVEARIREPRREAAPGGSTRASPAAPLAPDR